MLYSRLMKRVFRVGRIDVIDANGDLHQFGKEDGTPTIVLRLHDKSLHRRLYFDPYLSIGEAYMDGTLTFESGTVVDFIDLFGRNIGQFKKTWQDAFLNQFMRMFRPLMQFNPILRARQNVAHHYDLSDDLYALFLDEDLQYSCAYFPSADMSLEDAQEAKKRHLAAKLRLTPESRVLDIGSGWGGLAIYLARAGVAQVTGVTLSEGQHITASARAAEARVSDRVRFLLRDYRDETGRYDRIVSVGMFEHVGIKYYAKFFRKIYELLNEDGVALIHSIGRIEGPGTTSPWVRKYIFPGGYSPALSEVIPAVERSGLIVTDIEILRLHYAKTLKAWLSRFEAQRKKVCDLYDERFFRMWQFYLACSEMSFRHWGMMVFQMQLTKNLSALPLTRDYMTDWEREKATKWCYGSLNAAE